MPCKIAFFDLDGTLYDEREGKIPDSAIRAVKSLKEKGAKIVLATGRPHGMCLEAAEALGCVDAFVAANGAFVLFGEDVVFQKSVSKSHVRDFSEAASANGHALMFFARDVFVSDAEHAILKKTVPETLPGCPLKEHPSIEGEDVFLLCLYAGEEEFAAGGYAEKFPNLQFKRWHPNVLDVFEEEATKADGAAELLRVWGMESKDAIAFGDGSNDIELLQFAGIGVAMGNAGEKLKRAADFVTKPASEGGVAFALKHFGFI